MRDTQGNYYLETERDRQRKKDRKLSNILITPGALAIAGLAYFVARSIWTGKDQFGPVRNLLETHGVATIIVLAICVAMLAYALYLTIFKDLVQMSEDERAERIIAKFAPTYRQRYTRTDIVLFAIAGLLIAFVVGSIAYINITPLFF